MLELHQMLWHFGTVFGRYPAIWGKRQRSIPPLTARRGCDRPGGPLRRAVRWVGSSLQNGTVRFWIQPLFPSLLRSTSPHLATPFAARLGIQPSCAMNTEGRITRSRARVLEEGGQTREWPGGREGWQRHASPITSTLFTLSLARSHAGQAAGQDANHPAQDGVQDAGPG